MKTIYIQDTLIALNIQDKQRFDFLIGIGDFKKTSTGIRYLIFELL